MSEHLQRNALISGAVQAQQLQDRGMQFGPAEVQDISAAPRGDHARPRQVHRSEATANPRLSVCGPRSAERPLARGQFHLRNYADRQPWQKADYFTS